MHRRNDVNLSISIDCLDLLRLEYELADLSDANPFELFVCITDGQDAPFMSGLDVVRHITSHCSIPSHILLSARQPERHVGACQQAGCRALSIALESVSHPHRLLGQIRESGMRAGIALNPSTSLLALDYLLAMADYVCLLGCELGSQTNMTALPALIERVKLLRENICYRELQTQIVVYGGLDLALAGKAIGAGADSVVVVPAMLSENAETTSGNAVKRCRSAIQSLMRSP